MSNLYTEQENTRVTSFLNIDINVKRTELKNDKGM